MSLLRLRNISLSFGGPLLLDGADLVIEAGERIALVGRNGAGKSSLMKLIAGQFPPDDGELVARQGLKIARLAQEVPEGDPGSCFDVVAMGLGDTGELIKRYHHLAMAVVEDHDKLGELETAQHALESAGGWELNQRVETALSRLKLDPEMPFAGLSGGMKRRVLLAQALVTEPELLLLDEPTNHLDVEAIDAMEELLLGWRGALLFITHDRAFLRRLATRIVEVDRGQLVDYPGDYDTFLKRREERLAVEATENARFDKRLAEEETWIRQGIKARRTRNEGRVRALKAMRVERGERRKLQGSARIRSQEAERSGKLVLEVEGLGYSWDGSPIIRDLDCMIERDDKVGIIGPNGCGKTTLLKLLLGDLKPEQGTVKAGTRLEIAYFDQHRAQFDEDKSVLDNLAEGRENIDINGKPRQVMGYLQDFLFSPKQVRSPVSSLSGGERNRLLLARLFSKPANMLVLDEPTNDLDTETLDLLEELLADFKGTVLLVSHDRAFLDNVATSSLVFEGNGEVNEYVGGYSDWQHQRAAMQAAKATDTKPAVQSAKADPKAKADKPKTKLSYKDQRELEALPKLIEDLETAVEALQTRLADPAFYQQSADQAGAVQTELAEREAELEQAYRRWEELEG